MWAVITVCVCVCVSVCVFVSVICVCVSISVICVCVYALACLTNFFQTLHNGHLSQSIFWPISVYANKLQFGRTNLLYIFNGVVIKICNTTCHIQNGQLLYWILTTVGQLWLNIQLFLLVMLRKQFKREILSGDFMREIQLCIVLGNLVV